jgi:hypothetical protein
MVKEGNVKRLLRIFIILFIGILGTACRPSDSRISTETDWGAANLLIEVDGSVKIKRDGWVHYVPVTFGTLLRATDLVEVNGKAAVLCTDLSLLPLKKGRVPCPRQVGSLEYQGMQFEARQRSPQPGVPYVIYPRNTLILSQTPVIQWKDSGGQSYRVEVIRGRELVWQQEAVEGTSLEYPTSAPALQAGYDYAVIITDNTSGLSSELDPTPGLGFRIFDETKQPEFFTEKARYLSLSPLDDTARRFALAVFYMQTPPQSGKSLWGEAWLLLEKVAEVKDAPVVHLRLGNLLALMRLPNEAAQAYAHALQTGEASGDLETQAEAYQHLWNIFGDDEYFDQAVRLFEELGDASKAGLLLEMKGAK